MYTLKQFNIPFLRVGEVHSYPLSLKNNNTFGLDKIRNNILNYAARVISDIPTCIYNKLFVKCYFLEAYTAAKVYLLLKSGSSKNLKNFTPIWSFSILLLLLQPLEKHTHTK